MEVIQYETSVCEELLEKMYNHLINHYNRIRESNGCSNGRAYIDTMETKRYHFIRNIFGNDFDELNPILGRLLTGQQGQLSFQLMGMYFINKSIKREMSIQDSSLFVQGFLSRTDVQEEWLKKLTAKQAHSKRSNSSSSSSSSGSSSSSSSAQGNPLTMFTPPCKRTRVGGISNSGSSSTAIVSTGRSSPRSTKKPFASLGRTYQYVIRNELQEKIQSVLKGVDKENIGAEVNEALGIPSQASEQVLQKLYEEADTETKTQIGSIFIGMNYTRKQIQAYVRAKISDQRFTAMRRHHLNIPPSIPVTRQHHYDITKLFTAFLVERGIKTARARTVRNDKLEAVVVGVIYRSEDVTYLIEQFKKQQLEERAEQAAVINSDPKSPLMLRYPAMKRQYVYSYKKKMTVYKLPYHNLHRLKYWENSGTIAVHIPTYKTKT